MEVAGEPYVAIVDARPARTIRGRVFATGHPGGCRIRWSLFSLALSIGLIALLLVGCGEDLSPQRISPLQNAGGRAYMESQPCTDVLAEYNAMKTVGHDAAVTHVSNVYNTKTGAQPYIAISDASARVSQCQG